MKPSKQSDRKAPSRRQSKLHLRFNKEKGEMAVSAQGWVTFFISLLCAVVFVLLWKLS